MSKVVRISKKKAPKPAKPAFVAHSLAEVAKFFGVHVQTVHDWVRDGMPGGGVGKGKRGDYDLSKIAAWREEVRRAEQLSEAGAGDSPALERYRAARAQREELALKSDRSELIPVNQVSEQLGRLGATLSEQLNDLARTASYRCAGRPAQEIEEILTGEFGRVLSKFKIDGDGEE